MRAHYYCYIKKLETIYIIKEKGKHGNDVYKQRVEYIINQHRLQIVLTTLSLVVKDGLVYKLSVLAIDPRHTARVTTSYTCTCFRGFQRFPQTHFGSIFSSSSPKNRMYACQHQSSMGNTYIVTTMQIKIPCASLNTNGKYK